ncbi:MAG: NAD-dependent epimerase/dehydratase family protein [Bacteroidales bacterium]|nr:NAD-dependent epimerase/dehydratase family protein [Bacteroidales bacterium]
MKVAITGASGHIGSCLIRELIKHNIKVKALAHRLTSNLENLGIEIVRGDLLDESTVVSLCKDVDVVFHLAAKIAIDKKEVNSVYQTNVEGTRNIVNSCLKNNVKRLIHFSSIHALDPHPLEEVLDENRPLIENTNLVYERSKAESERVVLAAINSGLDAVILNPTAVVGPFDYRSSYLGQALVKIYRNKLPMLVPGGYDWVDVRDIVQATIAAIDKGRKGERYLLSGQWVSLKELSGMIGNISSQKTPKLIAPMFLARIGVPFLRLYATIKKEHPLYTSESLEILENSNRYITNAKARKELGYNPRSIEETLRDTFNWYQKNGIIH